MYDQGALRLNDSSIMDVFLRFLIPNWGITTRGRVGVRSKTDGMDRGTVGARSSTIITARGRVGASSRADGMDGGRVGASSWMICIIS